MNVRQKKLEMIEAMNRARALEPSSFVPNKLLDTLIERMNLKNDAELCRVLEVQPPIISKIRQLGKQGVQFATFPETVVPNYPYFSFIQPAWQILGGVEHLKLLDQAVTVPSATTDGIGEACREADMVVSIGVNERDGGTIYNTQLLFDADGSLVQHRRKISPTYHERMIWGQGDGAGLRAVDTRVGRIGQLPMEPC